MSYKHANAVRVFSKAKGMPYLIFCELAALMRGEDGALIDDQRKLIQMLRVDRNTLRRAIKSLIKLGELSTVPTNRRGIATEYRSLLGELESSEMYEHIRDELNLVRGAESTPNEDSEIIRGAERTVRGAQRTIRGAERPHSGCGEHPPKTLELLKPLELQNANLSKEKYLKAKTKSYSYDQWKATIAGEPLKDQDPFYLEMERYGFDHWEVNDGWNTFTSKARYVEQRYADWLQLFKDTFREHAINKGKNS